VGCLYILFISNRDGGIAGRLREKKKRRSSPDLYVYVCVRVLKRDLSMRGCEMYLDPVRISIQMDV